MQSPDNKEHFKYDHLYELLNHLYWQQSKITCANSDSNNLLESIKLWSTLLNKEIEIERSSIKIGQFDVKHNGNTYSLIECSSGERVLLYYILLIKNIMPKDSFIVIDEPETHLETNTVIKLFDELENIRNDCTFMYLTHNIDFVTSRKNAKHLWLEKYKGNLDFEIRKIDSNDKIPYELITKIYGSSRNILFCEGEYKSLDYSIYSKVLDDYNIYPAGSCENVIQYTTTLNSLDMPHEIIGIIDADYRNDEDINDLGESGIFTLPFADIENLLISSDVLKFVISNRHSTLNFDEIKNNIITAIKMNNEKISESAQLHIKKKLESLLLKYKLNHKELDNSLNKIIGDLAGKKKNIATDIKNHESEIENTNDYDTLLKIVKNKGLKCSLHNNIRDYIYDIENILKDHKKDEFKLILRTLIFKNKPTQNPPSST